MIYSDTSVRDWQKGTYILFMIAAVVFPPIAPLISSISIHSRGNLSQSKKVWLAGIISGGIVTFLCLGLLSVPLIFFVYALPHILSLQDSKGCQLIAIVMAIFNATASMFGFIILVAVLLIALSG